MTIQPEQFMQQAVDLALMGQGRTAPNPPVGAVVVRNGEIVGRGYHPAAGKPHAEVFALQDAGRYAEGAEIYVTLEPCCHYGRTGPCTEAIIASGVRTVFVGAEDPNPKVAGQGVDILRKAGVNVETGLLEKQCAELIRPFAKHIATGLPYVVYKAAMTLDGQTSTASGDSRWISCEESRQLVHQLRNRVDAIAVGSGTVNADNPRLTTRLDDGGRDPVRVIFDRSLTTTPQAKVYQQDSAGKTLLVTADTHTEKVLSPYRSAIVEIVQVEATSSGLNLFEALSELGKRDIQYLLLEGGRRLANAMLYAGLIDRMMVFVAPKVMGGGGQGLFSGAGLQNMADALRLNDIQTRQVGHDILIQGEVLNVHRAD